jgi:F-type H+-transporting ATPase subunit gamma
MSKQRVLRERIEKLSSLELVLEAMRSLALVETKRLSASITTQQENAAFTNSLIIDFFRFYPDTAQNDHRGRTEIRIVLGAERGLCGDFNRRLVEMLNARRVMETDSASSQMIVVGTRLAQAIGDGPEAMLDGASIVEDVPHVASALAAALDRAFARLPRGDVPAVWVTHHRPAHDENGEGHEIVNTRLLPFAQPQTAGIGARPSDRIVVPYLNLQPGEFLAGALEHYLLVSLHSLLYESLLSENHARLIQLENALDSLNEKLDGLRRRKARARQEEIISEIELMLLNTQPRRLSHVS